MTRKTLDASQVRLWLKGQKEADRRSRRERVRFLLSLTPEQALALYLALWETGGRSRREPSALLLRFRHCLQRWSSRPNGGPSESP